jgi:hypothetical protein
MLPRRTNVRPESLPKTEIMARVNKNLQSGIRKSENLKMQLGVKVNRPNNNETKN